MAEDLKPGLSFVYNNNKIPEGAIPLSPSNLYKLQSQVISKWQPAREMYILKHGSEMLGFFAAFNGAIFTNHFRQQMGLRTYARIVTYVPTIFLPAFAVVLLHQGWITYPMSVGYLPCSTCAEIKSITIQSVFGVAKPFVLSVSACLAMAKLSTCYPLPPFNDYKRLFKILVDLTKPAKAWMVGLLAFNIVNTLVIDYKQRVQVELVNQKLIEEDIYVGGQEFS